MLDALVRLVRVIHMTIGITEPKPTEERAIALVWLVLFLLLLVVFIVGLFVLG
jgi:cytochrome b561